MAHVSITRQFRLLFCDVIIVSLVIGQALGAHKYALGRHRHGKKITGQQPLEEFMVSRVQHCLRHCTLFPECQAMNFGTISSTISCQLFSEQACAGYQLEDDGAVTYYDVTDEPGRKAEMEQPYSNDPVCTQQGYCSASCRATEPGGLCKTDSHCDLGTSIPYGCHDGHCRLEGFWEVYHGFFLPYRLGWQISPGKSQIKRLRSDICSLDVGVMLGGNMTEIRIQGYDTQDGDYIVFKLGEDLITLVSSKNWSTTVIASQATAGMVTPGELRRLVISWCEGNMAVGTLQERASITGQADIEGKTFDFIWVNSFGRPSVLDIHSGGVADSWLFEEQGSGEDPVFEILAGTYISLRISPTTDITVKFDCKAASYAHVAFDHDDPETRPLVCLGCNHNTAIKLTSVNKQDMKWTNIDYSLTTSPILNENEFNTFTVRYGSGAVTVHKNDDIIFSANATTSLIFDKVIIGSTVTPQSVRLARYDPRWRTDTWRTEGRGFMSGQPGDNWQDQ